MEWRFGFDQILEVLYRLIVNRFVLYRLIVNRFVLGSNGILFFPIFSDIALFQIEGSKNHGETEEAKRA